MENQEQNVFDEDEFAGCDLATKPTHIPPGASPFGKWSCDKAKKEWFWNDPNVAFNSEQEN